MKLNPLIFSLLCIIALTGLSLSIWLNLPELEHYPIHWNAAGEADSFGSRKAVLFNLMIMPVTLIFNLGLFYILPKIEPLRQNLEDSRTAYIVIWVGVVTIVTLAGFMICLFYATENPDIITLSLQIMAIGLCFLFMVIGNIFGKVRQNYMLGIRTPWTLSSELSWEKTHRFGGRVLVLTGLMGLGLTAFFSSPEKAIIAIIALLLIATFLCIIYSYLVWSEDPHKRV